jgi:hypothetical protein
VSSRATASIPDFGPAHFTRLRPKERPKSEKRDGERERDADMGDGDASGSLLGAKEHDHGTSRCTGRLVVRERNEWAGFGMEAACTSIPAANRRLELQPRQRHALPSSARQT